MRRTIPGQPGEDEYDYRQGQRAYPIEGSSRPLGDPRVQQPSNHPNQRFSHSIPIPVVQNRQDHSHDWADSSRLGGESWKGDKYSRQPQKDMFNPCSSSSCHPTNRVHPSSDEEESSDDSYSSNGSGSETAAPSPRSGRSFRSRGNYKTRSTAPSIPTLPPLDIYRGSSNPSGLSKSKSQQPWVAEPSGHKEKESARLPARPTSSRQDPRGKGVMSQQPWVGGLLAASSDSQSRSGNKEKESAQSSGKPSSSRPDP
jgi:hypothetical protein